MSTLQSKRGERGDLSFGGGNLTMSAYASDAAVLSCQGTWGLKGFILLLQPLVQFPQLYFLEFIAAGLKEILELVVSLC